MNDKNEQPVTAASPADAMIVKKSRDSGSEEHEGEAVEAVDVVKPVEADEPVSEESSPPDEDKEENDDEKEKDESDDW